MSAAKKRVVEAYSKALQKKIKTDPKLKNMEAMDIDSVLDDLGEDADMDSALNTIEQDAKKAFEQAGGTVASPPTHRISGKQGS